MQLCCYKYTFDISFLYLIILYLSSLQTYFRYRFLSYYYYLFIVGAQLFPAFLCITFLYYINIL